MSDTTRDEALILYAGAGLPRRARYAATDEIVPRDQAPIGPGGRTWWDVHDTIAADIGSGMLYALVGNFGAGKTVMACCFAWHAACRGLKPRYTTAPAMCRALLASFRRSDDTEPESVIIRRYTRDVGMLIVDEAHERSKTESGYADRRLREIIDQRYGAGLDTLLVSNELPAQFALSIGPAVVDRMAHCGGLIECDWPSFRCKVKT